MHINPIGILHRKCTHVSEYSVKDYYSINPGYGTREDFSFSREKDGDKVIPVINFSDKE